MIVVYGATGYTGRLVAAELVRLGEAIAVAGRNEAKLNDLAAGLRKDAPSDMRADAHVEVRVAAHNDHDALVAAFRGADAVISCAGPFEEVGDPVVDAAVAAGVAFCDSTGEPGYMARVMQRHADAGVPVVPACGFDYVPHTLAASFAVSRLGADVVPEVVETALLVKNFGTSAGTKRSAVGAVSTDFGEYDAGRAVDVAVGARRRHFTFPAPWGRVASISYPGGDLVQLHRQYPTSSVRAYFVVPELAARVAPSVLRYGRPLLAAGPVANLLRRLIDRGAEGPTETARAKNRWAVIGEATAGDNCARAVATGRDVYGLTAILLARIAQRLADPELRAAMPAGACAPAQVVGDPQAFAEACGFSLRGL